jgi:glycerol kinase
VDGGAVVNDMLMQFQADILGIPVIRPETIETTALGAAYLAGLAVKYWQDTEQIKDQWKVDRTFDSAVDPALREELLHGWQKAVSRAKHWETNP